MRRTDGALAAQPRLAWMEPLPAEPPAPRRAPLARPVQRQLFPDEGSKVVPIADFAPARAEERPRARKASGKPAASRRPRISENQGSLDFMPSAAAAPRTLSTTVEAVIYCEAPVAVRLHRAVAAALDWSMVAIGYGLFLMVFWLAGGQFVLNKPNVLGFGGGLVAVAFAYGLLWALAGTETAGMRWTQLRLLTFEGFPPDRRQRLLRFAGSCLSVGSVAGLLWPLGDEESLSWQDHISRTFPTPMQSDSQVFHRK